MGLKLVQIAVANSVSDGDTSATELYGIDTDGSVWYASHRWDRTLDKLVCKWTLLPSPGDEQ